MKKKMRALNVCFNLQGHFDNNPLTPKKPMNINLLKRRGAMLLITSALLSVAMPAKATQQRPAKNVVERLSDKPQFSTLVTAVKAAGLVDALSNAEAVTIFAPTNDAFAKIPAAQLNALLADKAALTRVLTYHVAPQKLTARNLKNGPLKTLEGGNVDISIARYHRDFFRVRVNDSNVVRANIIAKNGVIHGIDRVLDPGFVPKQSILEIAGSNPNFSTLASLVKDAKLDRLLGNEFSNLTVFAPTNAAFSKLSPALLAELAKDKHLLRLVLANHIVWGELKAADLKTGRLRTLAGTHLNVVVSNGAVTVDGIPVAIADVDASNGVIHAIGDVLIPSTLKSLVDVAKGRSELSTFVTALGAANLTSVFSDPDGDSFTIFAPDNDAFAAIPPATLNALLADPVALGNVLKLHVVKGRFSSFALFNGLKLRTLSGETLTVRRDNSGVSINGTKVNEANLKAGNGVIHIMDGVLSAN
jgi:transforming growth factor-beta-induced protein